MAVGDRLEKPHRGPEPGTIETYDVADNLGRIRLATGEVVRFGKTACKGFEPAVGVKVHVVAASPHPRGGLRTETVVLDPGDAEYAQKVAARDSRAAPAHPQRQGPPPPPRPKRDVDAQLLRRLGNIAGVNAMVRGGQDPAQIYMVPNYNAERVLEAHRPRVGSGLREDNGHATRRTSRSRRPQSNLEPPTHREDLPPTTVGERDARNGQPPSGMIRRSAPRRGTCKKKSITHGGAHHANPGADHRTAYSGQA